MDQQFERNLKEYYYKSSECPNRWFYSLTTLNCEDCDQRTNFGKDMDIIHPCQNYYLNDSIAELKNQQSYVVWYCLAAALISMFCTIIIMAGAYRIFLKPNIRRTIQSKIEEVPRTAPSNDTTPVGTPPEQRHGRLDQEWVNERPRERLIPGTP